MWNFPCLIDIMVIGGYILNHKEVLPMTFELTDLEFRRLLDMVYIGNWVLNSTRPNDRFADYDLVQEKLFSLCAKANMPELFQTWRGHIFPSKAYEQGGIHEAIADYEDSVFFDILAEELALRDMQFENTDPENLIELTNRMDEYISEFEKNGIQNLTVDI